MKLAVSLKRCWWYNIRAETKIWQFVWQLDRIDNKLSFDRFFLDIHLLLITCKLLLIYWGWCQKIVNAALKAKTWTVEAKTVKMASMPFPGLKDYITG